MDNDDVNIEDLIVMLDKALTSNDTRVKSALRQLLMMTILTDDGSANRAIGPIESMMSTVQSLNNRVHRLENDLSRMSQSSWPKSKSQSQTASDYWLGSTKLDYEDYKDLIKQHTSSGWLKQK